MSEMLFACRRVKRFGKMVEVGRTLNAREVL